MSGLYSAALLQHAKAPEGAAKVPRGEAHGEARNPLCGDEIRIQCEWSPDGRLEKIIHETRGCALCRASASLAVQHLQGLSRQDARTEITNILTAIETARFPDASPFAPFNRLSEYPARLHCARLPWLALHSALH